MIMTALLDTVGHQECYKCLLFRWVLLHSGSVLSCLARNKNEERRESSISDVRSTLGCVPCLQSDLMKRRTFGQLELQTGRQWVKVSSCPLRTDNVHSILSPFFSSTPLDSSQPFPPQLFPPLRCLDGFKMDLHFPGHLGWWSPLPQGLGRPLELLLEKNTKKIMCLERKVSMKYWVYSQTQSGLAFLTEVINLLPALWKIKKSYYNNEFPQEGTTTSCQGSVKHDMRILPKVRFPTRAALLEWFDS